MSSVAWGDGFGSFDPETGLTPDERREILAALDMARAGKTDDPPAHVMELLRQMDEWMGQTPAPGPIDGVADTAPMEVLHGLN